MVGAQWPGAYRGALGPTGDRNDAAGLPRRARTGECVAVPWCETCDRFYNPGSVAPDGTCTTCGRFIADPPDPEEEATKIPWHFWLLVIALVIYLGWRFIQLIQWILR